MKPQAFGSSKILVIIITFILINLALLSNHSTVLGAVLSNDDIRPELNTYWVYKKSEFAVDEFNTTFVDALYRFNLSVKEETIIKVGNQNVSVLIIEGTGKIERWPSYLLETKNNEFYFRQEINKENLELIKKTQYITLEYSDGVKYDHRNITYSYTELTKPAEISKGRNWTKKAIRTEEIQTNIGEEPPKDPPIQINYTFLCDKVENITVAAGSFETFLVIERQWDDWGLQRTVEYYYSKEATGFVKKVTKNMVGQLLEIEELQSYGIATSNGDPNDDNNSNGEDKDGEDNPLFNLQDQNTQILLGVICIVLAIIIIGYIASRKKPEPMKEKEPKKDKKSIEKNKTTIKPNYKK